MIDTYRTKDLGLAASISTSGIPIINTIIEDDNKIYFEFNSSTKLKEIVDRYWVNDLQVDAQTLNNELKRLKIIIHTVIR